MLLNYNLPNTIDFCIYLQHRFVCRSVEYNYVTLQCHLSDSDRRTTGQYVQFVEAQGVDYFENLCIKGNKILYSRCIYKNYISVVRFLNTYLKNKLKINVRL